jgi:nicotinamidase-related amidase
MPPEPIVWPEPPVAAAALPPMIEPSRTALVVIDVQVDFVAPEGAIGRAGVDLAPLAPALQRVEALIGAARAAGAQLALVRVVTRPETDSRALKLFMQRRGEPAEALAICRAGTPGADYYRVAPQPGDIEVQKTLYSSFAGTRFEEDLRARGVDTLVVAGFTTECCVDSTVRDAFHRDFNVFVVADACAAYEPRLHMSSLDALAKNCAMLVETAAVLEAWER